jgi:hypothetical protein
MAVVVLVCVAWGCWQAMEVVADYSPTETVLLIGGYVACALALFAFFKALRSSPT